MLLHLADLEVALLDLILGHGSRATPSSGSEATDNSLQKENVRLVLDAPAPYVIAGVEIICRSYGTIFPEFSICKEINFFLNETYSRQVHHFALVYFYNLAKREKSFSGRKIMTAV